MTDLCHVPDVIDFGVSHVLAEDEVVHVPPSGAALAKSLEHVGSRFVADIPDWESTPNTDRHCCIKTSR